MALADIVSRRFYEALDLELTWKHMISCNWTVGGKMPVCAGNDAEVALQPFSSFTLLTSNCIYCALKCSLDCCAV